MRPPSNGMTSRLFLKLGTKVMVIGASFARHSWIALLKGSEPQHVGKKRAFAVWKAT